MIRTSIAAATVFLAVAIPTAAQAKSGYMTCQLYESGKRRVVYTRPFTADSASIDAMYDAFVAEMHESYVSDLSGVSGACHWEPSQDAAEKAASGYREHYTKDGANAIGVPFSPPAVLPKASAPSAAPAAAAISDMPVETSLRHADKAALMLAPELIARTRPKSAGSSRWFMCAVTDRGTDSLYYSSTIEADAKSGGDLAAGFVAAINADRGLTLPATAGTCRAATDEVKLIDGFDSWRVKQAGKQIDTAWMAPVG